MDENIQNQYDRICQVGFINLYSTMEREGNRILLQDFDINNEEHLFIYNVAVQVAAFFGRPIYISCSFWDRRKLYRPHRKAILRLKKLKKGAVDRTVDDMLNFMRPAAEEWTNGDTEVFKHIYQAFYKKGKK